MGVYRNTVTGVVIGTNLEAALSSDWEPFDLSKVEAKPETVKPARTRKAASK